MSFYTSFINAVSWQGFDRSLWMLPQKQLREEWVDLEDVPNWVISNYGEIRNLKTKRTLTSQMSHQGYLIVNVPYTTGRTTKSLAKLVVEAFVAPSHREEFNSFIHIDGNKRNCRSDNLMRRPRAFATYYHKMFDHLEIRVAVRCLNTNEEFDTVRDAAMTYGMLERELYYSLMNGDPVWPMNYIFTRLGE